MTRSMHFTQGSFSLMICFFTMASNARSGVNRPVLKDIQTRQTWSGSVDRQSETHTAGDQSGHKAEGQMDTARSGTGG